MRNRFIPVFSFTHVGALHRSTLHSAMNLIRRNIQIKKAPQPGVAAGTLWRLRRPNSPANLRLKRGYAASNSKTDIEPSIFPEPLRFLHSKKSAERPDRFTADVACRGGLRKPSFSETQSHWGKRARTNSCA